MDVDPVQRIVERHFRVYETRREKVHGEVEAVLFFLMFPPEEFDRRYEAARQEILAHDPEHLVFVRREGGEDILVVAPRPPPRPQRLGLHGLLFGLTLATTIIGGSIWWTLYQNPADPPGWTSWFLPDNLLWGFLAFSLPLLLILGLHEAAHYIAARRHGLRASLPFFIPFPPMLLPIGTMGAFISLRDPMPDRKALFDVGASGPLVGFLVAVPVLLIGIHLTDAGGVEVPDLGRPFVVAEQALLDPSASGTTVVTWTDLSPGVRTWELQAPTEPDEPWDFTATATVTLADGTEQKHVLDGRLDPGETRRHTLRIPEDAEKAVVDVSWNDRLIHFGDPLLLKGLDTLGLASEGKLSHPTFFAGWVGLLITGINLLPAGQLDGGHVARAVLGDRMRFAAYASLALLLYVGLRFQAWILMVFFLLLIGLQHPPPLNDRTPLDTKRKVMAGVVLLVFALTFVARPIVL